MFNKAGYVVDNFDRALNEGWIEIYFQPIIRTSNGRVCAEEALVRWEDPLLGTLNPFDFVPALEAVNQAHRLDLYVLEKTLAKMNEQRKKNLYVVPTSINLSQVDFYTCDIVDEVAMRVESSGISKHMIAIEISEGSLSLQNDFIISQIEQFQELGFQVWMDDFGSGDSALPLLQIFPFDLLKINIYFVKQLQSSESARIILTELIRIAMSLGFETVVEGVEYKEQVEFLQEIGCTRMQGFYFCKPIPISQIFERYAKGNAIGFENPKETDYYASIGKISLYDLSFAQSRESGGLDNYFDTFPMAIFELDDKAFTIIRSNKSFREFYFNSFEDDTFGKRINFSTVKNGVSAYLTESLIRCAKEGKRQLLDERMRNGKGVQVLLQYIATNPVKKVSAVAVIILSVFDKQTDFDNLTYSYVARVLSEDYINLYLVDMDTEDFVEYSPDGNNNDVSIERHGRNFFLQCQKDIKTKIYEQDREMLLRAMTKENMKKRLKEQSTYSLTYRLLIDDVPTYVRLKAVRVNAEKNHILIGINNIDLQMKERDAYERIKEERTTYSRVMALTGDFICIYTVNPDTETYVYSPAEGYSRLNIEEEEKNFFAASRRNARKVVYHEDLREFIKVFQKDNVLAHIRENGFFKYKYRLNMSGDIVHVALRATLVEEEDGTKLIVGIINIENQVLREMEYATTLSEVEDKANRDQLTGVKNKRAYVDMEDSLDEQIEDDTASEFAIIVCDLNGLKQVNDTMGHQSGDEYIKEGCDIICDAFSRSPVYRIGGDEFVVVASGKDYNMLEARLEKIQRMNRKNKKLGKVTIAVGEARFESDSDKYVSSVFERADAKMYENKKLMKDEVK